MKRTQIQLPDSLFTAAHDLAEAKEISMAELVRRGLEYMLATNPGADTGGTAWELPKAQDLQSHDPFTRSDWREHVHMEHLKVAEVAEAYGSGDTE